MPSAKSTKRSVADNIIVLEHRSKFCFPAIYLLAVSLFNVSESAARSEQHLYDGPGIMAQGCRGGGIRFESRLGIDASGV